MQGMGRSSASVPGVIAFVVAVADRQRYAAIAEPAIERVREVDSPVLAVDGGTAPARALNAALDELAGMPDLEAAVIVHEDVVLRDIDTAAIVRRALADPAVAIVGPVGARGVSSLAWWQGTGVGRAGTPHSPNGEVYGALPAGVVDALDGIVLGLGPWAVRALRFDLELADDFHGYDIGLCFQARHHGRRVEAIELATYHEHRPLFGDTDGWVRNELRFRRRWFEHRPVTLRRHRLLSGEAGQPPERR